MTESGGRDMAFLEVTKPPLGIVCVALVVTVAVSGCGTSDEDRAVEYALKACEERPYGAFNLVEPTGPPAYPLFRANRELTKDEEDALGKYNIAYEKYVAALDDYTSKKAAYDSREREFLYERKKNASAAAQLDDAYRVLAAPPSTEAFLFECAAVKELHG